MAAVRLLSWVPSFPYPPEQAGRWDPITSTIDWCEENYYATIYSAEIVNTLTNLLFMYLAAKGIHNCLTQGHDLVFVVGFIGYLLVGTGSFLFHATLKYPMQLIDELSMIYTTCLMCFATFSYGKTRKQSTWLAIGLISLAVFITLYYHYLQDPTFHQIVYAILTVIVVFRSFYVMEVNLRPSRRSERRRAANPRLQDPEDKVALERENQKDKEILSEMWVMIRWGLSIFLGGFFLWHLDRAYCYSWRRWRREIGLPWGLVLEGHGWWHVMTGVGAYFYLTWGIWLRHCLNFKQDQYELVWPHLTTMPVVLRRRHAHANRLTKED